MHVQTSEQPSLSLGFGGHTCNWGAHLCCLYQSDGERDEIVFGLLHQGDLDADVVVYGYPEASAEPFVSEYGRRFPREADHPRDPQRFLLLSTERLYHPSGTFRPLDLDPVWRGLRDRAAAAGRHARGAVHMDWALRDVPGRELLIPYEARIDGLFRGAPLLGACLYDLRRFSGDTIAGVLRTHRFTVSRGAVVENPDYDPGGWLAEHAPDFPPLEA